MSQNCKFQPGTRIVGSYGQEGTVYSVHALLKICVVIYDDAPLMANGQRQGESASFRILRVIK